MIDIDTREKASQQDHQTFISQVRVDRGQWTTTKRF